MELGQCEGCLEVVADLSAVPAESIPVVFDPGDDAPAGGFVVEGGEAVVYAVGVDLGDAVEVAPEDGDGLFFVEFGVVER